MSLFNKIKDILFEEEEQTETIKMVKEEPVKKEPVERKVENSIQSNNDFNGNIDLIKQKAMEQLDNDSYFEWLDLYC